MKKKQIIIIALSGMALLSCGGSSNGSSSLSSVPSSSETPSSSSILSTYVTGLSLATGVSYTGYVDAEQVPYGEGDITYSNGDLLNATFPYKAMPSEGVIRFHESGNAFEGTLSLDDKYSFTLVEGKYAYANGQYYHGKFVSGLFEDENGVFSYHTRDEEGVLTYSYVYTGGFKAGSVVDQTGSLLYPASFTATSGTWEIDNVKMKAECQPYPDQDCTYKELLTDHTFTGDGHYDGTTATYVKDVTYKGVTDWLNGCTYTGEYKNGVYDGQGKFVWDLSDGRTELVGTFVNGTPADQVCTKYFACNFTKTIGCWYFKGTMATFENPAGNQAGTGAICYDDGSVYTGDIYFNGDFASGFLRDGTGSIDGSNAEMVVSYLENVGSFIPNNYGGYYIGYVDGSFSKENNFINGDAIIYVMDASREPYGYITGQWLGWSRTGTYKGEEPIIRDGFTRDLTSYI